MLLWRVKNRGAYTRLTSMVPWLGFNLAETTSAWKRPSAVGAQLSEAPAVEAGPRKPSVGEGTSCWKPGQRKTNSAESPRGSAWFQKTSSYGRRSSLLWLEGHMPNEILTPLQSSLVSCFLEPPTNRQVAVGATEGLWRGYSPVCPKGTICWAPVAVTQASGGTSVLTLLCAKDQANEIREHRSNI